MLARRYLPKTIGLLLAALLALLLTAGTLPAAAKPNAPQAAGDALWSSSFLQGTDDGIFAIALSGTDLYVGGDFLHAGTVAANHIARYNLTTHRWYALGAGVNNRVYAIAVSGSKVYVGGGFNAAGGVSASGLVVWDTGSQTWSQVGGVNLAHSIFSPEVRALAFDASGNLIAGGMFEHVGTLSALNVAKWSGTNWSALGAGLGTNSDTVYAIATSGSDIYAGGSFSYGIAHWGGASWSGLGGGTSSSFYKSVNAIAVSGSLVYAGGDFDTLNDSTNGNVTANHIAQWNTTTNTWAALSNGANNGIDASVYSLTIGGGNLYAGGQFNHAGGVSTRHIAMWNGAWNQVKAPSDLNDGTDNNVDAVLASGNDLYVGGYFLQAGSWEDSRISRWDISGQSWNDLANSLDGPATALAISGNDVFAGGIFHSAGGTAANGIARWNAISDAWSPLGTGVSGCVDFLCFYPTVSTILVVGQDVYAGGNFYSAGGVVAHSIARWNRVDQQWHALGGGVGCSTPLCSADVYALTYDGGCVIVGGAFDSVNGTAMTAHNLAQWCGSSWGPVVYNDGTDHIVDTNGPVYALNWDGGYGLLYVGGSFTAPVTNLFSLDYRGGVFNVGDPLNGAVRSIVVSGISEFIGGDFTSPSGNPKASYIAEQTGASFTWLPLGNGLNSNVDSLALQGNSVIAAGSFTTSGAIGLSHVARWDGSSWSGLGSGTDNVAYAVAADNNFIDVGGAFMNAGGKPAFDFSRWGAYQALIPVVKK
jgi:hypothetical protein